MKKEKISIYFVLFLALIYFSSQFSRASLGAISNFLINEFSIDNEQLGRLGGVFFLSFALVQIPIGILLDKYNPIKIIFFMLLFVFIGSILMSFATSYRMLIFARIFQGIGCGVCLMGPLVMIARYVDKGKFSQYSGYVMGIGGLGALVATKPFFLITSEIGWRLSFLITSFCIILLIFYIIYLLLFTKKTFHYYEKNLDFSLNSYVSIFSNKNFLLMMPMSIFGYASFAFLLTLWGSRYLSEMQGLKTENISNILMCMALFWTLGSIFYGYIGKIIKKKKIIIYSTFIIISMLFILTFFKDLSVFQNYIAFSILGFIGSYTLILIAHYKDLFEENNIGKVLTTANLFNFSGVFFVQWFTGFIIQISVDRFKSSEETGYMISFISLILCLFLSILLYIKTDDV